MAVIGSTRKKHIELILEGVKTQTRRRHKRPLKAGKIYAIKRDWFHFTPHWIMITRVRKQRLGDITAEEAQAEGGYTIEEFKEVWRRISGAWDPNEVIVIYEFKILEQPEPGNLNGFLRGGFSFLM